MPMKWYLYIYTKWLTSICLASYLSIQRNPENHEQAKRKETFLIPAFRKLDPVPNLWWKFWGTTDLGLTGRAILRHWTRWSVKSRNQTVIRSISLWFCFRREWFFILVQNFSKQSIKCVQIWAWGKEFFVIWGMRAVLTCHFSSCVNLS